MRIFFRFFASSRTMALLFIFFATAMAIGTFIENDYGTIAAKSIIYESWWFELIMLLLIINFICNIHQYQLLTKKKLPVLIFHLSFIIIFLGGAISRYVSFEGIMRVREGSSQNEIISDKYFFQFKILNPENPISYNDIECRLSTLSKKFEHHYTYKGNDIKLKVLDFIPNIKDSIKEDSSGIKILEIITSENNQRKNFFLTENNYLNINGNLVGYNVSKKYFHGINIIQNLNGELFIKCNQEGNFMIMKSQIQGKIIPKLLHKLNLNTLYSFKNTKFVVSNPPKKGKIIYYKGNKNKDKSNLDLIVLQIKTKNTNNIIKFKVGKGNIGIQVKKEINGIMMGIGYGSKIIQIPFGIKLRNFEIEKYPGSNFPSSYASEITVVDGSNSFDYRIFMNNTLNYKGFRFYQSGFDPDEKGTILSVNHDFLGTTITYIGYSLLIFGIFLSLFHKKTRFWKLNKELILINQTKKIIIILMLFFSIFSFSSQNHYHFTNNSKKLEKLDNYLYYPNNIKFRYQFNKNHIKKFKNILVQSFEGRIMPINTLALQLLRKLSKKDNFYGMSADEWLLAVSIDPMTWIQIPIIKIGNKASYNLLKKININEDKYISLIDLFPMNNFGHPQFILQKEFELAFSKPPSEQNHDDKEIIEINEKAVIIQNIISNQYLKFFPLKNHPNNLWVSWINPQFKINEEAKNLIGPYFKSIIEAMSNKNWKKCDKELAKISYFQEKWGKNILPSKYRIKAEVLYNQVNPFFYLMISYSILGGILIIFSLLDILIQKNKKSRLIKYAITFLLFLLFLGFIFHLLALILHSYISNHAPWSNGYEAIIFISWIGILSGFIFYKNRNAIIPSAGCLVAAMMMIFAHFGVELNPQITPLVPVLKSYWLMIHVAIITSSYGFFALSALIGMIVLVVFIFSKSSLISKIIIQELTIVNELSLTIGIFLLTIGTFLGGIWANESWGRYWSWDPKETWALISIIIYAFVLHSRLIPKIRGYFSFNFMSLIAFSSIIMTYFGVNYYLSGLHSYASGDPFPVPNWIYYTLSFILLLSIISYFSFHEKFKYNEY